MVCISQLVGKQNFTEIQEVIWEVKHAVWHYYLFYFHVMHFVQKTHKMVILITFQYHERPRKIPKNLSLTGPTVTWQNSLQQ
jgi:hypothetical protein